MNVFAITLIRFIASRQNLAWTYYLTLGTSLRNNFSFSQNPRWPPAVKYLRHVILVLQYPVNWIQTKFGMDILIDPRNKPAEEFIIFSQNLRWPPGVQK